MPRSLKPQQVREYVSGETGERIPIMFDRNDLTFFAQYGADFVHDKTAAGIPAKLEALIKLAGVVDWQRCIELHRVYPPSGGASITLWHKTFEWGYRSDGKLMQRSWHRDFGTTGNAHHWSLSYTSLKTPFAPPMYLGGVDFLVYTPELDEGLRQLEEEGLMQVFYLTIGRREPVVGVVGSLQFDVIASRLENEYGAQASVEPTNHSASRWLADPDRAIPPLGGGVTAAVDRNERPVLLFTSKWDLEYFERQHPDVKLLAESPRR